jgi:putative inorganic carbon (HCO3(-)) transporter
VHANTIRQREKWASGGAIWFEGMLLALATPFLLFPDRWPVITVAALVGLTAVWLLRLISKHATWRASPLNAALLLFGFMVAVGIAVTPLPETTLPKAAGLILGLASLRFVTLWTTSRRRFVVTLAVFAFVGFGILAVGVLGANWGTKIPALGRILARLPRWTARLPDAPDAGISPNQLAGILAFYLPLAVVGSVGWRPKGRNLGLWLLLFIATLVLMGVLLLTQSRGGWIGGAAGLLALMTLAGFSAGRRWARRVLLLALALIVPLSVAAVSLLGGPDAFGQVLYAPETDSALEETVGPISIEGRVEIWSRALYAIADFPFTGCGLGTFREVVWLLYPLFLIPASKDIAHAHNIFLQTALDLGLPGLVAYVALLIVALVICWHTARRGDSLMRRVALGLAAGLVGLHVYGLTDAVALGSKPGLAFWIALGIIAVLPRFSPRQEPSSP